MMMMKKYLLIGFIYFFVKNAKKYRVRKLTYFLNIYHIEFLLHVTKVRTILRPLILEI